MISFSQKSLFGKRSDLDVRTFSRISGLEKEGKGGEEELMVILTLSTLAVFLFFPFRGERKIILCLLNNFGNEAGSVPQGE